MSRERARPIARFWRRWQRHGWVLLAVVVLVALAWGPVSRHVRAASLLLRFQGMDRGVAGRVAEIGRYEVSVEELSLEAAGRVPGRRYRPVGDDGAPGLLLVHGVHFRGMNEPRLAHFARVLASAGFDVYTPQVRSLAELAIEPEAVEVIGRVASAFADRLGDRAVGVAGISFAGGLALMAAADDRLGKRIGYVVGVGAHHDLGRVARWYAGRPATGPDGEPVSASPHPYGAGVIIHNHVEAFFPPEDVPEAREALRLLLHERWKDAEARLPQLTEQGQTQLRRVLERDEGSPLRERLLEVIDGAAAEFRRVSPAGRIDKLDQPVLLVHGIDDPVIPSSESSWIARELPESSVREVVLTPALRHAEQREKPSLGERWELVHFLAELLDVAE